jgi:hypothetical protein
MDEQETPREKIRRFRQSMRNEAFNLNYLLKHALARKVLSNETRVMITRAVNSINRDLDKFLMGDKVNAE